MTKKNIAALLTSLLILATLIFSSCAREGFTEQVQAPMPEDASLIVIDKSGNALPIVFRFSREDNGVNYYREAKGEELTREEIVQSLTPQGMTVEEVGEIWGTSITDVFALFTTAQLTEPAEIGGEAIPGAASNAALIYDMWKTLTTGPSAARDNPRGLLGGTLPDKTMSRKLFDFLEQRKQQAMATGNITKY
jgi:hypothetical protein